MALEVQVKGAEKLRAMADALRKADREDLRRGLDRAIRKAAKPTVQAIKESAEQINTKGIRKPPSRFHIVDGEVIGLYRPFTKVVPSKGTRKKIAAAVGSEIGTGGENARVSFRVRSSKTGGLGDLPRRLDEPGTFRHPVMGNREVWVAQTGDPWFFPPIKKNLDTFRKEIDRELDVVREKLERA